MWKLRAIRIGSLLVPCVPPRAAYQLCSLIGCLAYLINASARTAVLQNLSQIDPECRRMSRHRQALRVFSTVVTNYYDLARLHTLDRERFVENFDLRGEEHIQTALAQKSGVIVVAAHVGNFNVVASYPPAAGFRAVVIAERLEPPELYRYITRLRSALGIEVVSSGSESIRPILRALRENNIVIVASDRDVAGNGIEVDFFGSPARLPFGPVVLAMRTGASLLPVSTLRMADGRSLIIVDAPLELRRSGDWNADLRDNMERVAQALEVMIKRDPGQWAVLQSIWSCGQNIELPAEPRSYRRRAARLEHRLVTSVQHSRARRRLPRYHPADPPVSTADIDSPER